MLKDKKFVHEMWLVICKLSNTQWTEWHTHLGKTLNAEHSGKSLIEGSIGMTGLMAAPFSFLELLKRRDKSWWTEVSGKIAPRWNSLIGKEKFIHKGLLNPNAEAIDADNNFCKD